MEESLTQMLAGMLHVLAKEECALVGGHTSESEEIALGLSVTGYVMNNQHTLKKGSPNAGDVILVTKAIGTGTILAADMRAKAKGKWVAGAISSMLQSNRKAANILHSFNATACTDVTGFGVVGHLLEMLQFDSNSVAAELYLNEVPVLEGAEDCIKSGILSTLHPEVRINIEFTCLS